MYVVKVFHGYISKEGRRTRDKTPRNLLVFYTKKIPKNSRIKSADVLKS